MPIVSEREFKFRGRELLISYTCGRCGKTYIEPLEKQHKKAEGNMQSFRPPEGWTSDTYSLPMLCDQCTSLFKEFIKGAPVVVERDGEVCVTGIEGAYKDRTSEIFELIKDVCKRSDIG